MRHLRGVVYDMTGVITDIERLQEREKEIQDQLSRLYVFREHLKHELREVLDVDVE